jgi:hypothetical protein
LMFVDFFDGLIAKIVVALDHNKGIAKAIKVTSGIALDDSAL